MTLSEEEGHNIEKEKAALKTALSCCVKASMLILVAKAGLGCFFLCFFLVVLFYFIFSNNHLLHTVHHPCLYIVETLIKRDLRTHIWTPYWVHLSRTDRNAKHREEWPKILVSPKLSKNGYERCQKDLTEPTLHVLSTIQ